MKRWVLWGALVPGAIGCAFAACGDNGGVGEIFDDGGTGTTQRDGSSGFGDDGSSPGDDSSVILPSDSGGGDTGGNTHDQFVWPDCSSKPAAATTKAITDIWTANYTTPTEVWISGAYVTAVSRNGCTAGQACQIFLQTDLTYATLADGAHHGIKMFVSAAAAEHLVGIAVGDKVDALGYAWRYNLDGQNELLVQVNLALPGCAKKTGTGAPTPITAVSLNELSVVGYEQTYGPLLVEVATSTSNGP